MHSRAGVALLVLVPVLSLPRPARAEAEPSCETVTTVRCTGSVAPLALPGAQPGAVAPAPSPPPPVLPPMVLPPMVLPPAPLPLPPQADDAERPPRYAPPGPPCCEEPPRPTVPALQVLPGGWRLVRVGDDFMLERKKRTGVAGVWAPGLVLSIVSYVGTSVGGYSNERPWAGAPFLGGFIAGGINLADGKWGGGIGYTVGSIMQLSGFVMFLIGTSVGQKIERMPVAISPLASRDGGGVSIRGSF